MKRKAVKKLTACMLTAAVILGVAGCGDSAATGTDSTATSSAETKTAESKTTEEGSADSTEGQTAWDGPLDLVTIYPSSAITASGLVTGYKADVLAKRGLQAEVWAFSDEKTNAILASGDLPDIMYVNSNNLSVLIDSGMIMSLDEYLTEDKLPHIATNDIMKTALNYVKEFRSGDTGMVYGIPAQVGVSTLPQDDGIWADNGRNSVKVNWDVYYAAGCPEINSIDDLIPAMKKMMETQPEAEDGTKTWGTMLNSGSDTSYWGNMQLWNKWFGYESDNLPYLIETDMVHSSYSSILDTERDSLYYKGLKWYNECYREGVMDPDSINNDRETQKAKVEKSLACMIPSGTAAGWAGYLPVYIEGQQLYPEKYEKPYGADNYLVVNANCKNIDAVLRMIDMLADTDAFFELNCGPEGILWEYGEDGLVYPTEYGLDCAINGKDVEFNGEKYVLWMDSDRLTTSSYANTYLGPNGPRQWRGQGNWTEVREHTNNDESYVQWRETFGYDRFYDQIVAENAFTPNSELDNVTNFCAQPDDAMQLTIDAIKQCVVEASWKMVYSESDEEFEKIWDQMIQDCRDLDAESIVAWRMDELSKAQEIKDSLNAE